MEKGLILCLNGLSVLNVNESKLQRAVLLADSISIFVKKK